MSRGMFHRRSIRLKRYDYSQMGAYFVTITVQHWMPMFGEVVNGTMHLNDAGRMVQKVWDELPIYYPGVVIDAFVVMPDHIHGIVVLDGGHGDGGHGDGGHGDGGHGEGGHGDGGHGEGGHGEGGHGEGGHGEGGHGGPPVRGERGVSL